MSLKVALLEGPRTFSVVVGQKTVGRVISYSEPSASNDDTEYAAETKTDDTWNMVGWYGSIREGAKAILDELYYDGKIDEIVRRKA